MFNSVILDVAIGLVFIYLLYSLLATIIQELIATKLAFRAKMLEKAIIRMLEDGKTTNKFKFIDRLSGFAHLFGKRNLLYNKKFAMWFYAHPLIKYLGEDNFYSKPAYLSAQNFSKVIIDLLKGFGSNTGDEAARISDSIKKGNFYYLPIDINNDKKNPAIAAIRAIIKPKGDNYKVDADKAIEINTDTTLFLKSLWEESGSDVNVFKEKLENWYDDTMERVSGWYKRYVKYILFVIGLSIAIGFNVDSVMIAKKLMRDPKLREQMVQNANNYLEKNKDFGEQLDEMNNSIHEKKATVAQMKRELNVLNKTRSDEAGDDASERKKELADSTSSLNAEIEQSIRNRNLLQTNLNTSVKTANALMDTAKNLIDGEIKNVNELMGLGWRADTLITGCHDWLYCSHHKHRGFLCFKCNGQDWTCIIGWLITALAISLGAPFWFSLLDKLMKLRSTGRKKEKSASGAPSLKQKKEPGTGEGTEGGEETEEEGK